MLGSIPRLKKRQWLLVGAKYLLQIVIVFFLTFSFKKSTFFCMNKVISQNERSFVGSVRFTSGFSFQLLEFLNGKRCIPVVAELVVLITVKAF